MFKDEGTVMVEQTDIYKRMEGVLHLCLQNVDKKTGMYSIDQAEQCLASIARI